MFENLSLAIDPRQIFVFATGAIVLMVVTLFLRKFLNEQRRDKYNKIILGKSEGAAKRAVSIILDAEARAMKNTGRDEKRPFELVNWYAIKRDLKRAGLPTFPPLLFLAAAGMAYAVAAVIIAAPIYNDLVVAAVIYPAIYFLFRTGIIGMFMDMRKMKMLTQLVIFIESVQRAVSVGTSPDESVAEAIKETEAPLRENLVAIRELLDLGYDFIDAINLAADRINMAEFDIFAASMTAQSTTGGSIGEVLKEVIDIARSRLDLQKKISTMTAEGRFNALLLGSLPIGLIMYLRSGQAEYANAVWTVDWGIIMYFTTLGFAVLGAWLAMRIAKITV